MFIFAALLRIIQLNKNDMKQVLLTFLLIFLPMLASADAVEIDGICYNMISKGKVAEVTNGGNYSGEINKLVAGTGTWV